MSGASQPARGEGLDIGFVAMGFPPDVGGIETHLGLLARELQARGHRVHVLCLDSRSAGVPYTFADAEQDGVRVRRVAYRYHDHRALADLCARGPANDAVMAWLAEEPCDVVHVHHASGFGAGALAAIADMGRPLCVTLHDYWLLCPRGQMLRHDGAVCESAEPAACGVCLAATWPHLMPSRQGEPRDVRGERVASDAEAVRARTEHSLAMLALATRVFAPSAAARDVYEKGGVPAGRIQVLENGVDARALAERVAAERRAAGARQGSVRIGVLGSAQPSKGVLEFARAALALEEPALALEVHGRVGDYHGDESYARALRELAARDSRLSLHGEFAHAELPRVLARLDAVAAPSRWNEVYGLSAREARAAGLFVLASDRGGLASLRGDPGVRLLPAEDASAWSAAIAQFVRELRAGRTWPAPEHQRSVRELALELEAHYLELAPRRAPPHTPWWRKWIREQLR